jgi:REP element-mobilizing transposase RayT
MVSRKAKQIDLFLSKQSKLNRSFAVGNLKSHPKSARPVSTKDLMHVVFKSTQAKGPHSFLGFERSLLKVLQELAVKLNVSLVDIVVMGNHIHLSLKVKSRRAFSNYLRAASGLIARKVLGAERHRPSALKKFFDARPFSRIVACGKKSWRALARYFELNRLEKCGFSKHESKVWNLRLAQFTSLQRLPES